MFTEEEIAKILDDAKDELRANLVEDMKSQMKASVEYTLGAEVRKVVVEYVKDEIVPGLKARLIDDRPIILKAAIASANEVGEMLSRALVEDMKEKLGKDYTRRNILNAIWK